MAKQGKAPRLPSRLPSKSGDRNWHRQYITSRSFPSDALLPYQNKFLECLELVFPKAFQELFENVFPLFKKLSSETFGKLRKDAYRYGYAELWRIFIDSNEIYPNTFAFIDTEPVTPERRSRQATHRLERSVQPQVQLDTWGHALCHDVLGAATGH